MISIRSGRNSENASHQLVSISLNPTTDRVIEVPRLVPGDHIQGKVLARYPAGKAINLSRALAILGHGSLLTGFIGREERDTYRNVLESQSGGLIQCDFIAVNSRTRENITLIDLARKIETHIREDTFFVDPKHVSLLMRRLAKADLQDAITCLSGSLPRGFDDAALHALIDLLIVRGGKVVVDSGGSHLRSLRKKGLWLIKPNIGELEQLTGSSIDKESDIRRSLSELSRDFEFVLASVGDKGAYLMGGEECWHGKLELKKEEVKSTVGCGDCLLAGFLAGIEQKLALPEALRLGLASAAANAVLKTTADYSRKDLAGFLGEVHLESMKLP